MHNYDPINKFSIKTRLGNWSEEWDLEETKRKQYLRQKNQGISTVTVKERNLTSSLQSASLTFSRDGYRHFGDHVMLFNAKTEAFLVNDSFEKLLNTEESYNVSTVKGIHACVRAVFIIDRVDPRDGFKDNIIHWGQRLRIRINPMLIAKDIFLYSEPSSINRYSKVSRLQEVILMLKTNANSVWICDHPDPNNRMEMEGKPIKADQPVLLRHEMTNQWLASDTKTYQNTFGQQFEVMCHNFLVNSKSQNLYQEKKGLTTVDVPSRAQKDQNLWLILGAADPEQEFDESLAKKDQVDRTTLFKKLKHLLTERGLYGIRFLHKVFRCLDKEEQGLLDPSDFRWGLQSGKIFVSEPEVEFLIKEYKAPNSPAVDYRRFMSAVRGKLSQARAKAINQAFNRIQKHLNTQRLTLQDLAKAFDAKKHPQVLAQRRNEKQVFNEFVWSWDNIKPDYVVEIMEFGAYFEDLSAMITRDDHFEFLLLSVFHL